MPLRGIAATLLGMLALVAEVTAQTEGGTTGLEVPVVELVYERPVVLPPSRKGEVLDTVMYSVPPHDDFIFGDRITNLYGDGGPLPDEREFDDPLVINVEASLGSYLSPLGRVSLEYVRPRWNLRGTVGLGSTGGHLDGAEARGIRVETSGEYQIAGDLPSPGKARIGADLLYQADEYKLFGRSTGLLDRRRTIIDVDVDLSSETDLAFDYALSIGVEGVDVDDDSVGFERAASVMSPEFGARFRVGDDSLNVAASLRYLTQSVDYGSPTDDPDLLEAIGAAEWSPSSGLLLTAGGIVATAGDSDGGSSTLLMPRVAVRYELSRSLGLYGRFAPELRAPSYRSRITRAPYVDPDISLRPEKLPIAFAAGLRLGAGNSDLEFEGAFETTENTPVVTLGEALGVLDFTHRDANILRLQGTIRTRVSEDVDLKGRLMIEKATDDSTDRQLPMRPLLSANLVGYWRATGKLTLDADIRFEGEQNISFDATILPVGLDPTLGARFLLGVGGTYGLTDNYHLFARITNAAAQNYDAWQGYEAPGLEARVGVRGVFD